jgi:hypothetical protein
MKVSVAGAGFEQIRASVWIANYEVGITDIQKANVEFEQCARPGADTALHHSAITGRKAGLLQFDRRRESRFVYGQIRRRECGLIRDPQKAKE